MNQAASPPRISVVIPCYNQAYALPETLARLAGQSLAPTDFEVIVVDDGSTDGSKEFAQSFSALYPLKFFSQDHKGAAASRNLGARQARGELLLFLDVDMIAEPDLLAEHLESHSEENRTIVVGRRKPWPPAQCNLYSQIIDIDSNVIEAPRQVSRITYSEAFTCNMSIKTQDFWKVGEFDETIHRWEDMDFSYRAKLDGFSFFFNPQALAYHNHPITFDDFCKKMHDHYIAAVPCFAKHPGMFDHFSYLSDKRPINWRADSLPLMVRKLIRRMIAFRPVLAGLEKLTGLLEQKYRNPRLLRYVYWKIIASYELIGFRDGMKRYQAKF